VFVRAGALQMMMTKNVRPGPLGVARPFHGAPAAWVQVIDEAEGATTTLGRLAAAGCDSVLDKPASGAALVREVRRLEGVDANETGLGSADGPRSRSPATRATAVGCP
jgi:hypothetical protein